MRQPFPRIDWKSGIGSGLAWLKMLHEPQVVALPQVTWKRGSALSYVRILVWAKHVSTTYEDRTGKMHC